ncbi:MAG: radical SAM family heme chaperone HemW [Pseudomonadota bacterium]
MSVMEAAPRGRTHAARDDDGGFGIYVHWPFCQSKCPYCDFNSHVRRSGVDQDAYAAALSRELVDFAQRIEDRWPSTVFFGGGTPSLMEARTVGAVLEAIDRHFGLPADAEISLEANPTSVEAEKFEGFRAAGVNRVSLGVQSLVDDDLRRLGRLHDGQTARRALALATGIFDRVSADLIYARPGQTTEAWAAELSQMLEICGGHLSLYQLTIEPQTRFHDLAEAGKLVIPEDDLAADLYDLTHELTAAAGFRRYEVSNHARQGEEAQHNLIYWRGGRYVGVGPGAHGRVVHRGRRMATSTIKSPEAWLERVEATGSGVEIADDLSAEDMGTEMLVMGLRLAEGIDTARFARRVGCHLQGPQIAGLVDAGVLVEEGTRIRIPDSARLLTNAVVRELVPW